MTENSIKPTVLLMNDSFPPIIDGVANVTLNYAKEIQKTYGNAVVLTPDYPGVNDSGYPFMVRRYASIDTRKAVGYMAGVPFSPKQTAELKDSNIRLIHSHCPVASQILAREIQQICDVPLIMTYHTKFDYDIQRCVKGKLLQDGAIRTLVDNISASDEVWAVSRGAGENLRSLGYEGDYVVMENGVDMEKRLAEEENVEALRTRLGVPHGIPVYLFIGRMVWYKNQRIILDALKRLAEEEKDFRFLMIGDGSDLLEMKAYTATLGLTDKVIFTGAIQDREEIRSYYTLADLLLFPSVFDTNGLVVREASAVSTPAVLVRGSSAAEGVTHGENGFLIEENAESLAALLTSLHGNEAYVRKVGDQAAEELYISWEQAVKKATERYQIVIDRYRSGNNKKHHRFSFTEPAVKAMANLMDIFSILGTKMSIWE